MEWVIEEIMVMMVVVEEVEEVEVMGSDLVVESGS